MSDNAIIKTLLNDEEVFNYVRPAIEGKLMELMQDALTQNNHVLFEKVVRVLDIESDRCHLSEILIKDSKMMEILIRKSKIMDNPEQSKVILNILFKKCSDDEYMKILKMLSKEGINIESIKGSKFYYLAKCIQDLMKNPKSIPRVEIKEKIQYTEYDSEMEQWLINSLCKAIATGNQVNFNELMNFNFNINGSDTMNDSTPIMFAAQLGHYEMVKELLQRGASVENHTRGSRSKSALTFSVIDARNFNEGHIECIKLLISAGADLEIIDHDIRVLLNLIKDELCEPVKSIPFIIQAILPKTTDMKPVTVMLSRNCTIRMFEENNVKEGNISSTNVRIELVPTETTSYLLPIGISIDGVVLTQTTMCRFVRGCYTDGIKIFPIPGTQNL